MALISGPRLMPRLRYEWSKLPEPRPDFYEWSSEQRSLLEDAIPLADPPEAIPAPEVIN